MIKYVSLFSGTLCQANLKTKTKEVVLVVVALIPSVQHHVILIVYSVWVQYNVVGILGLPALIRTAG